MDGLVEAEELIYVPVDEHDLAESQVRSYCRSFPAVFDRAEGAALFSEDGKRFIDLFGGAGAVNYGHNNPRMKRVLMEYIDRNGIVQALDMVTTAKRHFMERFRSVILEPRGMEYKMQFTGPAGTNAVETALKIARLNMRRSNIVAFTNAYHGLTLGALAVTASSHFRNEAFVNRTDASFIPYDGYFGPEVDTTDYLEKLLSDPSSGLDKPAAVIVETIQAEGGINIARAEWLRQLQEICRTHGILLIVDDIQVGAGRTGRFFSFELAGIEPDIIVLSKSISGGGLPMSMILLKPELDRWKRGEETATFRGHNLSFVTGAEALGYWEDETFTREIAAKGAQVAGHFERLKQTYPELIKGWRGVGMIHGLEFHDPRAARAVTREAFMRGVIAELCGPRDEVLKCLPPLVIEPAMIDEAFAIIEKSVASIAVDQSLFA